MMMSTSNVNNSSVNYFQTSSESLFDQEDSDNLTQEEFISNILTLFSLCSNSWKAYTASDFTCTRTSLAMTNRVYFLSLKSPSQSDHIQTILVRLYGKSNINIQREKEMEIAKLLSAEQLAPKWYLSFANGRMEEYLPCQSVSAPSFRSLPVACQIISNLAKIHNLLPNLISGGIFPEENLIWRIFDERRNYAVEAFNHLLSYYQRLGDETPHEGENNVKSSLTPLSMLYLIQSWNPFHSEKVENLKENIMKVNSPLVYAHCDVHHGNIIHLNPTTTTAYDDGSSGGEKGNFSDNMLIIDFEYGIPTSRGYDLANFFCEFCGDYDSSEGLPAHEMNFSLYPNEYSRRILFQYYCYGYFPETYDKESMDKVIDALELEVRVTLPLVHLQWAHWGIIKAVDEVQRGIFPRDETSFNYLRYAYQRYYQWYQETKQENSHSSVT